MSGNSILNKARYAKGNDEFYTTYETIEKEISHYKDKFCKKSVYCNCDNPYQSNFARYFIKNFRKLKLKQLICTSYDETNKNGCVLSVSSVPEKIGPDSPDEDILAFLGHSNVVKQLKGNGDFRSEECVAYLKQSDILVTNPPFSLFRELIALIIENRKQFLVIGNQNAITYKEIFPLIQNNQAWIGYQFGDMSFRVPSDSEPRTYRFWIDDTGQKWRSLGNAMWLTNIDIQKRHQKLELKKHYDPDIYPHYDGNDAIEVSRVADIPVDYPGVMGVPITFLNKHNPDQFEIVGEANHGSDNSFDLFKPMIGGKLKFKRILIRHKK